MSHNLCDLIPSVTDWRALLTNQIAPLGSAKLIIKERVEVSRLEILVV